MTQAVPTGSNLYSWFAIGTVLLVFAVILYSCATASGPDAEASSSTPAAMGEKAREILSPSVLPAPQVPSEEEKARQLTLLDLDSAAPDVRLKAARFFVQEFPGTPEAKKAVGMVPELEKALEYERSGGQWRYEIDQEGMSGKATRYARVESTNTINLDFPYSGAQHATLMLRRHPRWGNDVVLSIEKGQILCHSYGDCSIGVRFDNGKIIRLKGNPPADNSTESLFIPAFGTFLKQLPASKTVKIEVQVYQGGAPVFEFDVSGFKPEKFK